MIKKNCLKQAFFIDQFFLGGKIILVRTIPGSSNGRTGDSGSSNRGSNPCPGAIKKTDHSGLFFYAVLDVFKRQFAMT